jgi:micrococcal nuclease
MSRCFPFRCWIRLPHRVPPASSQQAAALQRVEDWASARRFGLYLQNYPCRVVKVYDGDSVTLLWAGAGIGNTELLRANCRLYGIDTPEMRGEHRAAALACRDALSKAILNEVLLVTTQGPNGLDKYGRPLVVLRIARETSESARQTLANFDTVNDWILHTLPGCRPYFGGTKGVDENKTVE